MKQRLDQLFYQDWFSRWRIILATTSVIAAWGFVSDKVFARPTIEGLTGGTIAGCVCFAVAVLRYCYPRIATARAKGRSGDLGIVVTSRRFILSSGSTAASFLVAIAGTNYVEAAVVSRRLRELTVGVPLSKSSINKIHDLVSDADRRGIIVPKEVVKSVQSALVQTAVAAPVVGPIVMPGEPNISTSDIRIPFPADVTHYLAKAPADADKYKYVLGSLNVSTLLTNYKNFGFAYYPEVAEISRISGPVKRSQEFGPGFFFLEGLTTSLDGLRLKQVVFRNMELGYDGGPLILQDVFFVDCRFKFSPSQNGLRALSAIVAAGWGWVTFFSEPKQSVSP